MEVPWKTKNRATIRPSNPTTGHIPWENHNSERDTCTSMFIAALFTIAKIQKQSKCPSTDEWIKKMWYIDTMKHYSAMRKKEILPFVTRRIDLEGIMLSEISQTEKDKWMFCSILIFFIYSDHVALNSPTFSFNWFKIQLTLEQHRFELCRSTYTWTFSIKIVPVFSFDRSLN